MDKTRSIILVKDSDDESFNQSTILISDDDVITMESKRKQEKDSRSRETSPSPSKKPRSEISSKSYGRKMSEIAEDGEIVSSPEYDAADMEIKIHAEVTSSEADDDDDVDVGTPTQDERKDTESPPHDVIQVSDSPEKHEDSFPQKELSVSKKRVMTMQTDEHIEIDHLQIPAPSQNEVKRGKIVRKLRRDEDSPKKSKGSTPEKDRPMSYVTTRDDSDKRRPYDVHDERRSRSDSENERRSRKSDDAQDDLRKHLLKRIGSDQRIKEYKDRTHASERSRDQERSRNREHSSRQREISSYSDERSEKTRDITRHRDSSRDTTYQKENIDRQHYRQDLERKRDAHQRELNSRDSSHATKSKISKQESRVTRYDDNKQESRVTRYDDSDERRNEHEKHRKKDRKERSQKISDNKPRKKKKRKHKSSESDTSPGYSEGVQKQSSSPEKSPPPQYTSKESNYDNISSGISEDETSPNPVSKKDASPSSDRSPSRSPSEASSRSVSRSPSLSPTPERSPTPQKKRAYYPGIEGCRNVEDFEWLNRIEEGTYGVVYRARDKRTDEIVALKRLKMEKEKEGFPITSLREINTLLKAQHPNIVTVREIVVGSNMDKIYIVMDYVEHDLKSLMSTMTQPFLIGEVKTLMLQLLRGVRHMHDNWILHRDIKASNLLLSHKGILKEVKPRRKRICPIFLGSLDVNKIGDFGLAREYGSPLKKYTSIVVTLWYRAPELLLGAQEYSTAIDIWSVGCVFAELLTMKPLFPGKSEIDQINKIFKELGTPNDKIWPGPPSYSEMPQVKKMSIAEHPYNQLRNRFGANFSNGGIELLNGMLTYDPARRITADGALRHPYFQESPKPVDPSMFPTWPAKSELGHKAMKKNASPKPPEGGQFSTNMGDEAMGGFHMLSTTKGKSAKGSGFSLKF